MPSTTVVALSERACLSSTFVTLACQSFHSLSTSPVVSAECRPDCCKSCENELELILERARLNLQISYLWGLEEVFGGDDSISSWSVLMFSAGKGLLDWTGRSSDVMNKSRQLLRCVDILVGAVVWFKRLMMLQRSASSVPSEGAWDPGNPCWSHQLRLRQTWAWTGVCFPLDPQTAATLQQKLMAVDIYIQWVVVLLVFLFPPTPIIQFNWRIRTGLSLWGVGAVRKETATVRRWQLLLHGSFCLVSPRWSCLWISHYYQHFCAGVFP